MDVCETIANSLLLTGRLVKNTSVSLTLRKYLPNSGVYDTLNDYNSVSVPLKIVHESRQSTAEKIYAAAANLPPTKIRSVEDERYLDLSERNLNPWVDTTEVAISTRVQIGTSNFHLFCADLKGKNMDQIREGLRADFFSEGDTFRLLETNNSFHAYSTRAVTDAELVFGLGTLLYTMGDNIDTRWVGFTLAKMEGFMRITENTKGPITAWPRKLQIEDLSATMEAVTFGPETLATKKDP